MSTGKQRMYQFWTGLISLIWLDETINFIFRSVAKTSELLLAAGIVISAADFLTDGRLMHNNLMLADAWAWTQAIAIESSSGVVLMYALQAFKDKDPVKAWLYLTLAALLALVGSVMLLTQIIYSTAGINLVVQGPLWFVVAMAALRTIVSIAYVAMCRVKHIRFAELTSHIDSHIAINPEPEIDIKSEIESAVASAIEQAMRQFDIAIQDVKTTIIEEVTQHQLIAIPKQPDSKTAIPPAKVIDSKVQPDRLSIAKQALIENPAIKDKELALLLGATSINTARNWKQKALAELKGNQHE
jgi:hypothetical protein